MWLDFALDPFPGFACGAHEFEDELQAQPEAGGCAKVAAVGQAQ
jgi:hypothetical protein